MCGRYTSSASQLTLLDHFGVRWEGCDEPLDQNYNVAPTDAVYAVLTSRPRGVPRDAAPVRQLRNLRWGLVPSWARDVKGAAARINARVETVQEKPSFRAAFMRRRCLLPASPGYYEWFAAEGRTGKRSVKRPVLIRRRSGDVLPMAGLYEFWKDPTVAAEDPDAWLVTCTIITTEATDDLGHVHDRMPMVVEPEGWEAWLDPELTDPHVARSLLAPVARLSLEVVPVTRAVGDVRNNGPHLIEPVGDAVVMRDQGV